MAQHLSGPLVTYVEASGSVGGLQQQVQPGNYPTLRQQLGSVGYWPLRHAY